MVKITELPQLNLNAGCSYADYLTWQFADAVFFSKDLHLKFNRYQEYGVSEVLAGVFLRTSSLPFCAGLRNQEIWLTRYACRRRFGATLSFPRTTH